MQYYKGTKFAEIPAFAKMAYLLWIPFDKEMKMKFYVSPEWFHSVTNIEKLCEIFK
ncbi:hypothetical protein [Winogradskyella bathintestinalis]|uniref:Uncharacterized protein n=1 Tax=Winogradskyella bathintestinalis TaxID=3035208 RepID=A0ABT7ZS13_9FLAO|nr:hypothetical protein [Winogradskyella bathintestinalis]MDN3491806.1 hypothetical protein [Winogradskyella bathintestinalis]